MMAEVCLSEEGTLKTDIAIGTANFAPGLRLPVELAYRSASESSGMFGYGWSCPQLESSAKWDKDGLLWTTPWNLQGQAPRTLVK